MNKFFVVLIILLFFNTLLFLHSQNNYIPQSNNPDSIIIKKNPIFIDDKDFFLFFYYDTLKYNPLLMPLIFNGKWVSDDTLKLFKKPPKTKDGFSILPSPFQSLYVNTDWKSTDIQKYVRQSTMNYTFLHNPQIVKYNEGMLPEKVFEQQEMTTNIFKDLFRPEANVTLSPDNLHRTVPKEEYWWKIMNSVLNVTQSYVSDNWYKGGESNMSLLNIQNLKFGYNDKKVIQFETEIECKFSFYNSPNDTVRAFRVNDDATFLKSKIGLKAVETFYYTFSTEFRTQLFNNYKANSTVKTSSFLSPANLYMSLGMDYKLKNKKIVMSVIVSPLSYRLVYVHDPEVKETNFGVDAGKKSKSSFGSMLTGDLTWTFDKQINWVSRLYYYTTYKKTEAEWENTFNFILNRYLSTKFMFHARFDDSAKPSPSWDYLQLRELLSFGIAYKW